MSTIRENITEAKPKRKYTRRAKTATKAKRAVRKPPKAKRKTARVAADDSTRAPIEIARFGEYVVMRRADLLELAALFKAVEQWRDAIEGMA